MEKKEPILTPSNSSEVVEEKKVADKPVKEASSKPSFKQRVKAKYATVKNKVKSVKFSPKQKKFMIAALVCLVIVVIALVVVSMLSKDKANVASLEQSKVEKKVEVKEEKKSFWSRLFSKDEKKVEVIAPSFDIVRMEKGEAVIAGQAGKGDTVHILDNGVEIGTEVADENGQWVFIPKKPLAVGNRKLSLYVLDKDGNKIKSKQSAVLHVSKKSSEEVAVIMGGDKKAKVLKAPAGQNIGVLRIAKIDYNDSGDFKVEGRAKKNATVNLYMNGKLLAKTVADSNGLWSVETSYNLSEDKQVIRADMLAVSGKVAKRVEYKFTPVLFDNENQMTVIKKGDCLWNIALKEYGRGTDYVIIFEANKSQIKDPNKIYVGQVFSVVKKDSKTFKAMKENK